ncbi:MAG TPA: SDR family NAD(P)-dependent oxidoreductase [Chitinophagaceae bacterium]
MQKKIIIVGGTSGIGRKLAEVYLQQGNKVGVTGRRNELLDEIKQQYPGLASTECFDVTQNENIEKLQSLISKLGGLDLLIISAGCGDPSDELSWSIDKSTVTTNVNGFVEIANWTFNFFAKQGYGHLAAISSIAATRGSHLAPAYSASKAFQSVYFEGLAIKATKLNKPITITCIEPGFVKTKMAKSEKQFWVVPVHKAAKQIIAGLNKKKRKLYISRRWWIIAKLMKWMPYWLYRKIG